MKKDELREYYQENVTTYSTEQASLESMLWNNSLWRILVFVGTGFLVYMLWHLDKINALIVIAGIVIFLYLVKRHLKLLYQRNFAEKLVEINQLELRCLQKDFHFLPSGKEFDQVQHEYCKDIDLFGKGSFFQYLNRTSLANGPKNLANLLKSNTIEDIEHRQASVEELSAKSSWRQQFWAEAKLVNVETAPEIIFEWLENYTPFIPTFLKQFTYIFSAISVILTALFILEVIPEGFIVIWLLIGLAISGAYVKKINNLSNYTSRSLSTFQQYSKLIKRIEQESWTSPNLHEFSKKLETSDNKASAVLDQFAKHLNALDQRSNIAIAVITNGLFLRDVLCAFRVEKWIVDNKHKVKTWFEVIDYFDVQNSLANFHYNHPDYHFPVLSEGQKDVLKSDDLGHPLLKPAKRVDNDFEIHDKSFYIITGANMAGKSTFLRTVSLAIVMSNIGLPICAKHAVYRPIKLVSSMRTSDSLSDDESYFFSELKRLRYIIDKIENDRYFIILDEILKGTNSVDKAEGSKKFVQRLVRTQSTGIIATHDLSLCETSDQFDEVENYYFDAEIIDDELYFDYSLKSGICANMNASFLLKKMDIV